MTNISRFIQMRAIAAGGLFCWSLWCVSACGCGSGDRIDPEIEKLGRATGPVGPVKNEEPPAAMPGQMMASTGKEHRGTILETIAVPNYTYIRFQTEANEEQWAAVPLNDGLRKGQAVAIVESVVMTDFASRSLGRRFPSIIFGIVKTGEPEKTGGKDARDDAGAEGEKPVGPALPPGHPPINAR